MDIIVNDKSKKKLDAFGGYDKAINKIWEKVNDGDYKGYIHLEFYIDEYDVVTDEMKKYFKGKEVYHIDVKWEIPEMVKLFKKGLNVFLADYIDDEGFQHYAYVVGRTYDSAFNRWYKNTCKNYRYFDYYFNELEDFSDYERFFDYIDDVNNIKAGIYSAGYYY